MVQTYLEKAREVYRDAAVEPKPGLCCTTTPVWTFPDLSIPRVMQEMNYGCGTTIHPRDLAGNPTILYVGVGGGMELLQFAYFSRRPGGVIGIDPVTEMRNVCRENLKLAESTNSWFRNEFIDIQDGDALDLNLPDSCVDVAAQNCLFNIFKPEELRRALGEFHRVLRPHGRMILSDPICDTTLPAPLVEDPRLRAHCISGALPLDEYVRLITDTGFGTVEIRTRRPYRVLDPKHYAVDRLILIESVEIVARKDPVPADGPCVFTGRAAIYFGSEDFFDDGKGHILQNNQPAAVCDKTARALLALGRSDLMVTDSTYFYDGGGCC